MSNPMSKQELGHTQTPEAGELTEILRDIRDDLSGIASGFYSEDQTELSTAMAAKAGEIIDYIDAAAEKIYSAYSTLLSRVSQLESDCRMKDEALRAFQKQCANAARNSCLVPPDGGQPSEIESIACDRAADAIMELQIPQPDAVQADARICATCNAILADGPQPAATYEKSSPPPAYDVVAAAKKIADGLGIDAGQYQLIEALAAANLLRQSAPVDRETVAETLFESSKYGDDEDVGFTWQQIKDHFKANDLPLETERELRAVQESYYRMADGVLALIPASAPVEVKDDFRGNNEKLIGSAKALLALDADGALVPHGIGGHARKIISAFVARYEVAPASAPVEAGGIVDRETIQTLLGLLNPLHWSLDHQTYDERVKENFDAPRDSEYAVNVTAQQERDLTQAVCILENRLKAIPESPTDAAGLWASILALMERFRHERMVWHLNNRTDGFDPDATPDHLSREAEASAILALLPTDAAVKALVVAKEWEGFINGLMVAGNMKSRFHVSDDTGRVINDLRRQIDEKIEATRATLAANGVK